MFFDHRLLTRLDQRRAIELLDHRRAEHLVPGEEPGTVVHEAFHSSSRIIEIDGARSFRRRPRIAAASGQRGQARKVRRAARGQSEVHDLDRLLARAEAIRLLVRTKERLPEGLDRSLRPDLGRNVDHELVVLTLISEVEAARQASALRPHALTVEPLTRSRLELEELLVERREPVHFQWSEPGPDLIRAQVLYEQADGTEDPGIRRNHDARDAQLAGERGRVQRARAPEGHEGEIV